MMKKVRKFIVIVSGIVNGSIQLGNTNNPIYTRHQ
jgi:hypothetical protein